MTSVGVGIRECCSAGLEYISCSFIKVFNFKLLRLGNIFEFFQRHIVEEPQCSARGVRHDRASLELDCSGRMMKVDGNPA